MTTRILSHTKALSPALLPFVFMGLVAIVLALFSLSFGIRALDFSSVWDAFTHYDGQNANHIVVREMRLPRALTALIGGGALGMAGALMQSISRNPLADPGLLGINGGAALGVVITIWGFGITAQSALIGPALIGAALASVLVLLLGGAVRNNGPDPTRLVLAGAAVGALFLAFTWAILILSRESLDVFRFWVLGGFTGIGIDELASIAPLYMLALPLAIVSAFLLDPLVLGDDAARALGVRVGLARIISIIAVILLCGTTVSIAGPISFIGLVVPHLIRPFLGADIRKLAIGSFFAGAILAICADTLGRVILTGQEVEAGAMMAMLGGPALILLVRMKRGLKL